MDRFRFFSRRLKILRRVRKFGRGRRVGIKESFVKEKEDG